MSKLAKELENWQQAEKRHAEIFGKDAIQTRGYQHIRLAEMQRIYRAHRGKPLSLDDRVRMRLLRSGNRHLEKQLYPNRFVRYTRRFILYTGRSVRRAFKAPPGLNPDRRKLQTEAVFPFNQPTPVEPGKKQAVVKTRIVRLPKRTHKPDEGLEHKRGKSL